LIIEAAKKPGGFLIFWPARGINDLWQRFFFISGLSIRVHPFQLNLFFFVISQPIAF
jgi:hypothetical protein